MIKLIPLLIIGPDRYVEDYYVELRIRRGDRTDEYYQCKRDSRTGEVLLPEGVKPLERGKGGMYYVTIPHEINREPLEGLDG